MTSSFKPLGKQLMTKEQAEQLKQITIDYDIDVYAYGLRTNFMTKTFEGSKRLFELADSIELLKNLCPCGEPAIVNARYDGETGDILSDGPEVENGGNERYIGLCYKCWKNGNVKDKIRELEHHRKHLKLTHEHIGQARKDLYIDFDGVILDTIPVIYKLFRENGIDSKDYERGYRYLIDADWESIINNTPEINESINNIKKLLASSLYNLSITVKGHPSSISLENLIPMQPLLTHSLRVPE
jgi:hypothetical protein